MPESTRTRAPWWQRGVVYQVYPRSFLDSDGDGVGDLVGLRRGQHHLVDLGVDAGEISPIHPSPMEDFGYDITDLCDVDPMFGSLDDLDDPIAAAHERDLKVLLVGRCSRPCASGWTAASTASGSTRSNTS